MECGGLPPLSHGANAPTHSTAPETGSDFPHTKFSILNSKFPIPPP
jgi:hypothetical protein